jgi:hypothetical protein
MTTIRNVLPAGLKKPLQEFRPRRTVKLLLSETPAECAFIKPFLLSRLVVWAALDQKPGKRGPKPNRRKIRTTAARKAGILFLGCVSERCWLNESSSSEKLTVLLTFLAAGGFSDLSESRGSVRLLSRIRKAQRELKYVYRIVDFLLRCRAHSPKETAGDVEAAKYFLTRSMRDEKKPYSLSKIEKIWLKYKNAAPYIYAFYEPLLTRVDSNTTPAQALTELEKYALNQGLLNELLGVAAHVADILRKRTRDVRLNDFTDAQRHIPTVDDFSEEERAIMATEDRKGPIED